MFNYNNGDTDISLDSSSEYISYQDPIAVNSFNPYFLDELYCKTNHYNMMNENNEENSLTKEIISYYHKFEKELSKPIEKVKNRIKNQYENPSEYSFKEVYKRALESETPLIDIMDNIIPKYFSSLKIEDEKETIQKMIKDVLLENKQVNDNYKKKNCSEEGIDNFREYKLQILLRLYIFFFLHL